MLAGKVVSRPVRTVVTARGMLNTPDATVSGNLQVLPLDVTSQSSVDDAVKDVLAHFGRIDVLVNNAGCRCGFGGVEEVSEAEFDPMYQT